MIYYFGTDLISAGHTTHKVFSDGLYSDSTLYGKQPFNLEFFDKDAEGRFLPLGTITFGHFLGFTVLAIAGSCKDTRPGSKSVFWMKGLYTLNAVKKALLETPIVQKMIEQMPFEIKWPEDK